MQKPIIKIIKITKETCRQNNNKANQIVISLCMKEYEKYLIIYFTQQLFYYLLPFLFSVSLVNFKKHKVLLIFSCNV